MPKPLDFIIKIEVFLDNGWFRWLVGPVLLLVSAAWALFAFRTFGVLLFLAVIALFIAFVRGGRILPLAIAWTLFFASTFSSVDFAPYVFGGQPRLVPVGYGCFDPIGYERQTMGELMIGWPGLPGLAPKRVLIWDQPPQSDLHAMSRWHLRIIRDSMLAYISENNGKMPPMVSDQQAETALMPSGFHEPMLFIQPWDGRHYLPNPRLSCCAASAILHPGQVLFYSEAESAPDGTRGVVFVNGRTDRLTRSQWQQLWSKPIPEPRAVQ